MGRRRSIHVDGFSHRNPIPNACRIGNLVYSGSVTGTDPATDKIPDGLEAQIEFMFQQVRRIVETAGARTDDIIKMTVWMKDFSQRAALNQAWTRFFPDAHSRPARHTMQGELDRNKLIECDFVAVIEDGR